MQIFVFCPGQIIVHCTGLWTKAGGKYFDQGETCTFDFNRDPLLPPYFVGLLLLLESDFFNAVRVGRIHTMFQ